MAAEPQNDMRDSGDDARPTGATPKLTPPRTKPHTSVVALPDQWFVACLASELRGRKPIARTIAGTPLAVFRSASGRPGALLDRCAHRNVPLSLGQVAGEHLQCGYHGWEFDRQGSCQAVPGLCKPLTDERRGRVPAYAATEQDGLVWVFSTPDVVPTIKPFAMPALNGLGYTTVRREVRAPGTVHAALENALDVPHTAYLHGGLFRNAKKRNPVTAKLRRWHDRAEVEYIGEPRPSGLAGRLLSPSGGVVIHFDRFFLPSIAQVEYRIGTENHFIVTAAATPVTDFDTRLFATIQFKLRVPGWLVRPFLEPIANRIFGQDAKVLARQSETIQRFGGEQFESTEIDLLGPHIYRLLKQAERGRLEPASDAPSYERTIEFTA